MSQQDDKWKDRHFDDKRRNNPERCDFNRDRARIIHSSSFRRLQGKTQVLGLGESDFYRTRLTHSMEVAQISSGIVDSLKENKLSVDEKIYPNQNLIEAIGLAHDLGHPPFGHAGEKALNYCLHLEGEGFEGNAQTFRICTQLGEHSDKNGFNLTRRTLLGLVKYPIPFARAVNYNCYNAEKAPLNIESFKPPKCIYEFDTHFEWLIEGFSSNDREKFFSFEGGNGKHRKTKYKSFDCSIMELADDISYGIHDLEDAVALNLVNEKVWNEQVEDKHFSSALSKLIDINSLFSGDSNLRKRVISSLIHYFIKNVSLEKQPDFDDDILAYRAFLPEHCAKELKAFQNLIVDNVIANKNVQMMEYSGEMLIIKLFNAINSNPNRFLPCNFFKRHQEAENRHRVISDYIAGMTDNHAMGIYHQIFTPDEGSVFLKL